MTPSERALQYAKDVVSGKIPNCKWVKLACQRFLDDLKKQKKKDWPYHYDAVLADRAVNFMERMPHTKGKWSAARQNLVLEPWQCFIECNIFGWVSKKTGKRRFRVVYEKIPRKNGKSAKIAARGIYLFCADGEAGSEVFSGATSEKQAHEVFRPAWMMVNKLEKLQQRFGISQAGNSKNPGTMFVMDDMSKFETLIGKPGDGSSPHAALIDEYHEHDTDHMVDTMQTGMGAREQPLLCIVTTAGSNLGGPCYEMEQDMQRILQGVSEDETVFAIMYGIDETDSWDDPASLIKANPNYNISVFGDFLLAQLEQARRSASKQNAFRTKHLNEWVGAKTAWMNMVAWQNQRKDMVMEDFKDCFCHVSVDLASKKDVAAVDVTFEKSGHYYSFKKFFAPEQAAEENEKYMEFVSDGCLELTDGAMIDQEAIEDYLEYLRKNFKVKDFAFDEWQADYMMTRLMSKKFEVVKYPFNTRHVSEPMKNLEALVIDGKYWHDGNKMMNWMMSNVAAKLDVRGNIFPNKARPNDPRCKIDGVAVAIMSIGRWITEDEPEKQFSMFFVG
ncbi:terminase large subunit [Larkinella harenae]